MSGLPWYAHNIKAYEDDTTHLTMIQHGAYRLMMDHYYKKAAPLPANEEQLLRICRAVAEHERGAVVSVLAEFFTLEADGYHNGKADRELAKMAEISGKRSTSGKKGAAAKSKSQANSKANVVANTQANEQANAKQVPSTLNIEHRTPVSSKEETGSPTVSRETSSGDKNKKTDDPWREVYRRGREILGTSAGGVITNLRKTFSDKPRKVLAKLEDAAEQREPLAWINAYLWQHGPPGLEGIDTAGGFI